MKGQTKKILIWGFVVLFVLAGILYAYNLNEEHKKEAEESKEEEQTYKKEPDGGDVAVKVNDLFLTYNDLDKLMEKVSLEHQMTGEDIDKEQKIKEVIDRAKEKLLVANYALEEGVERSDDIDQMIEELIHVYSEKVEVTEERIEEMYEEHYVSQVEEMGYEADIPLEDMREELEMGLVAEELESTFKSKAEEMKDSADIEVLVSKDYF